MRLPALHGIGRNVVVLGIVSLLTDVSSEMLYPIVPLFLTGVLAAPMTVVGLIEGLAESTASLLKVVSGRLADQERRRRPLVWSGYGLSAVAKPLLAAALSWPAVLGARLVDRVGKGLRGPPRDAMIAAAVPVDRRGTAFGLHRALDTVGAVIGPLVGMGLLSAGLGYRNVFLAAAIPAFLSVAALAFLRPSRRGVRSSAPGTEPPASPTDPPARAATTERAAESSGAASFGASAGLSRPLIAALAVIALFGLGNSSNAFLLLRARDLGLSEVEVIALYVAYNVVYALASLPAGGLSDRIGRRPLLASGFLVAGTVYAGFGFAQTPAAAWGLMGAYGLYSAATSGVARAWVSDLAEPQRLGTALGAHQAVTGVLALVASLLAGWLWARFGAAAPFTLSATVSLASAILLMTVCREGPAASR